MGRAEVLSKEFGGEAKQRLVLTSTISYHGEAVMGRLVKSDLQAADARYV